MKMVEAVEKTESKKLKDVDKLQNVIFKYLSCNFVLRI